MTRFSTPVSRRRLLKTAAAAATASAAAPQARAQTITPTPQTWSSVFGDATNSGAVQYATPKSLDVGWQTSFDEEISGHPVHFDGVMYLPTETQLVAVRAADGGVEWGHDLPGRCTFGVTAAERYVLAAVIDSDRNGMVRAVDRTTGDGVWTTPLESTVQCPPTVADDSVYVGDHSGVVYSLKLGTGRIRWRAPGESVRGGPVGVTGDTVFAQGRTGTVRALSASDGAVVWTAALGVEGFSTPVIGETAVYTGGFRNDGSKVFALDRSTGEQLWERSLGGTVLLPGALTSDSYVVQTGRRLVAFARRDGSTRWETAANGAGGVVTTENVVYALTDQSLRIHDRSDGTQLAEISGQSTYRWIPVALPSQVIVAADSGTIMSLEQDSGVDQRLLKLGAAGLGVGAIVLSVRRYLRRGKTNET